MSCPICAGLGYYVDSLGQHPCRCVVVPVTPQITFPSKGCICPPGSEETCKRSDCGRRDPQITTAMLMKTC